ncbi:pantetheine-phosphate adenylyltransferase [Williamsia sp. CHRR-6]|uniref:pantetheine-phosphate adenylyltransferase n=1 Tax=Williamsia sp. CHRR-6 TaxID=2835871 RepID=UPI001BD93327|nr:pantetheine-phosphate adenylyltransferase [Williamsia sp. CHRR-6]MBT0568333.1 pantetheine-phosphate adenylyltransferase [Williamsia sp. CHRR-6]
MTGAVCPGSFDPLTRGHLFVIEQCAQRFSELVVTVVVNPAKQGMFTIDERVELIEQCTAHLPGVRVDRWEGLLVDYLARNDYSTIVKGLRSSVDFEYEVPMAQMNRDLAGIETFFLLTEPQWAHVSSSLVKEVAKLGGDVAPFLPEPVYSAVAAKVGR